MPEHLKRASRRLHAGRAKGKSTKVASSSQPPRRRSRARQSEVSELPPILRRAKSAALWDAETLYGAIKAFGGMSAFCAEADIDADSVESWLVSGRIPNGMHMRLFGSALARGITICPSVFGIVPGSPASRGIYDVVCAAQAARV